jgi:hypothetical protein
VYKLIRRVKRIGTFSRPNERGDIIVDKSRPLEKPSRPRPQERFVAYRISEELYEIGPCNGYEEDEEENRVPIFTVKVRTVDLKGRTCRLEDLRQETNIDA